MNKQTSWTSRAVLYALGLLVVAGAAVVAAPAFSGGLFSSLDKLSAVLQDPFRVQWTADTPRAIGIFVLVYAVGIGVYETSRRNTRHLEEHGSAKWGDVHAIARKYRDKDPEKNILLTQNFRLSMDSRQHRRNLNVLCVGGSGSGKTRFFAKPNLLQAETSYVILDAKGEMLRDCGNMYVEKGYKVRVLDFINPHLSQYYNPFVYLADDKDIMQLVTNLIRNTTPKNSNSNDPFWERAETALLEP